MKFAHNVEHVKEKGEGSSSHIRLEKCEQSQILVDSSEETKIAYVNKIYTQSTRNSFSNVGF